MSVIKTFSGSQRLQEIVLRRIGDAPHHAADADKMHRAENGVEENEREPEMDLAERFIHHPTEHLWKPVVKARETGEENVADQSVVEVRHDEISVMNVNIHRAQNR